MFELSKTPHKESCFDCDGEEKKIFRLKQDGGKNSVKC